MRIAISKIPVCTVYSQEYSIGILELRMEGGGEYLGTLLNIFVEIIIILYLLEFEYKQNFLRQYS